MPVKDVKRVNGHCGCGVTGREGPPGPRRNEFARGTRQSVRTGYGGNDDGRWCREPGEPLSDIYKMSGFFKSEGHGRFAVVR